MSLIHDILEIRNHHIKNTGVAPKILKITKGAHQQLTKELEKQLKVGDENALELNKFWGMYIIHKDEEILEFHLSDIK